MRKRLIAEKNLRKQKVDDVLTWLPAVGYPPGADVGNLSALAKFVSKLVLARSKPVLWNKVAGYKPAAVSATD